MPKTSIKLYKKQLISLFAYANVVSITFVFLSYRLFTKFTEIFVSRIVVAARVKRRRARTRESFLTRTADKPWDDVDEVITALKRTSDANIEGLTLSYKKFPQPKDGSYSYVLDQAKKYQGTPKFEGDKLISGSGDANLSFDYNGVSFDNVVDGKLIDNKYGHGSSIFKETDELYTEIPGLDEFVEGTGGTVTITNQKRVESIITQAKKQEAAVSGKGLIIEWHISTKLGAKGIRKVFTDNNINIVVKYVPN